ncbi:hypothetical protein [Beijerinckia mobilis]|uniref:hypothetical protein n=1 Tax=Beijerinckia mobilis TaxID=231434 RepID=UPI0012EBB4A0|nr:hypothetical protein [Beijerinckia mobilis]
MLETSIRRELSSFSWRLIMRRGWGQIICTIVGISFPLSAIHAETLTSSRLKGHPGQQVDKRSGAISPKEVVHVLPDGRTHITYLYPVSRSRDDTRRYAAGRRHGRYVALVGDPESGFGFYPLPDHGHASGPTRGRPWGAFPHLDPLQIAIATNTARFESWVPANEGYRYGVFNPVDGVGTPFFAGYYSPLGNDAGDE